MGDDIVAYTGGEAVDGFDQRDVGPPVIGEMPPRNDVSGAKIEAPIRVAPMTGNAALVRTFELPRKPLSTRAA